MKTILYSKHSNERAREFSIRTDIVADENGMRTVEKAACFPEGSAHVAKMADWYEKLQEQLAPCKIQVNRVLSSDEKSVSLEYLSSGMSLEEKLYAMIQYGEKDKAFEILEDYIQAIRACATEQFSVTEEFEQVFGTYDLFERSSRQSEHFNREFPGQDLSNKETSEQSAEKMAVSKEAASGKETPVDTEFMSMSVTDIDMVPENIFLTGEDETRTLIDYEWTFDFPIPVNFVIYRIWRYFLLRNFPGQEAWVEEHCDKEGISKEELLVYEEMESHFQSYVTGSHVPLREMFADITPGSRTLEQLGVSEKDDFVTTFICSLSLCDAQNVPEWKKTETLQLDADGRFAVSFDLKDKQAGLKGRNQLRFDPLEGKACRVQIDSIAADIVVREEPLNGIREQEDAVFWTKDPIFHLNGDFEKTDHITIRGKITLLGGDEALAACSQKQNDLDRMNQEMERTNSELKMAKCELETVRNELNATRATKGYRALEKMRKARNKAYRVLRRNASRVKHKIGKNGYHYWYMAHKATEEELAAQKKTELSFRPKISILVPTYKTPINFLTEMLDSVVNQTYANWELCIADGGSGDDVIAVLKEYSGKDPRVKYTILQENAGIAGNTNGAAKLATGDYITLLDHDDLLPPESLFEVVQAMQAGEIPDVLYTDEDKVDMKGDEHFDPNFKPDFSPDLLRSHNYITHLFVVKKEMFDELGGFRSAFDGAQDYDLILRCTEKANEVRHVPKILYHWRMHMNSTAQNPESKMYAYTAGQHAIEEHLQRVGYSGDVEIMKLYGMYHVTYATPGDPLVSIIIPNKDHTDDLDKCIRSVLQKSSYRNLEIVVVENNSELPETKTYYEKIVKEFPQVRVITWEREFNYSAINNFGVAEAKGDYLLFLNNDTELLAPNAIGEMLGHCMRKEVGAVGAKLLYADDTVQHAGIILGFGGFGGHVFTGIKADDYGYMVRARINGNFSAVTAACLMMRREVFEEIGEFSEEFAVALNDVDLCMKVRKAEYLIVMCPFALWHHYESKSRGYEDTPEKQARFQKEVARFRSYWAETVDAGDPYYNPNFSVNAAPFTLV